MTKPSPRLWWAILSAALLTAPCPASAHFIWITVEPAESARQNATISAFFSEPPVPEDPKFLKYVQDLKLTVDGQPLSTKLGEESLDATWSGKLPPFIDAERDLGVMSRGEKPHRLYYTARAQTAVVPADEKETGDKLRVRLVKKDQKNVVQVLFDGQPVAKARIKIYPESGETRETTADEQGLAEIDGLAEGKTAIWANWADQKAGELAGKTYSETRYYATLTFRPQTEKNASTDTDANASVPSAFAAMPEPAVNSFGGAVLGDWLYVYSGHVGRTHHYSVETTSRHFRRLNLKDRTTWETLPMDRDVQGVALVSDGTFVYRIGGMSARNQPGQPHDLHSVAEFARFDPASKTWTSLAPLPQPRSTHDAVVIGRSIYVVGGWAMKGATEESEFCEDVAVFDLAKPESGWRTIAQPFQRRALSAAELGGQLYVLGGLNDLGKVERRVDVYDPSTNAWTLGPELPGKGRTDGFGTSAFGIDGRLYYSGAAGRIFRLDASRGAWEAVGEWSLPRITHRLLPGPDHTILAVGGNAKGKQTPVIEAVTLPPARLGIAAKGD